MSNEAILTAGANRARFGGITLSGRCRRGSTGQRVFFFQAEDGIRDNWRDWSSDVCSSDLLLKLLSMNNYDMEANSRQEMLTIFKQSYGGSMHRMCMLLTKFCPDMSVPDIQNFIYIFFPFMFGIYPYTEVTKKQRDSMKEAGINYVYQTAYELIYNCLIRILGE